MTSLQASLTALIAKMRACVQQPDDREAGSIWAYRVDDWADELATLVSSPPEVPMKGKRTHDCGCDFGYAGGHNPTCKYSHLSAQEAPEPEKAHISEMVTWDTPEQLDMAGFPANIAVLREQIATLEKESANWKRMYEEIRTGISSGFLDRAEAAEAALRAYGHEVDS